MSADPRDRPLLYHRAAKINEIGLVSALCYKTPHAIPLGKRQSWTIRDEAVTCAKCRGLIRQREAAK